ncbi:hypothetical protein ZWY2020_007132 [Hordeum vulgare]|nr:hypothetical protein ZWY2020_007132 [Hordeum vulgare]
MESWPQAILSEGLARQKVEAGHRRRWGQVHQPWIESIVHLREMRSNCTRAESNGVVPLKVADEAALPCRALDGMVVCAVGLTRLRSRRRRWPRVEQRP